MSRAVGKNLLKQAELRSLSKTSGPLYESICSACFHVCNGDLGDKEEMTILHIKHGFHGSLQGGYVAQVHAYLGIAITA